MKQTTPRQQAASRANGAKSSGPKTAAGKRRSSRNGCKHNLRYWWSSLPDALATNGGIHQYSRVAPRPPADDPEFIDSLAAHRADFQPRTPEAESAILALAVNMWLKTHLWLVRKEMMDAEIRRQAALHPDEEPRFHAALAFDHAPLHLLQRMEAATAAAYSAPSIPSQEKKNLPCAPSAAAPPAAKTTKMKHQTPPHTPAAPENMKNEAPSLTPPALSRCAYIRQTPGSP